MATDQQAAMEQLRALYREKNEHLEKFLEPVTPFEFYREIFPVGSFERKGHFEDEKGNGIAVTVPPKAAGIALEIQEEGKAKRYTITDELSELSEVYDTDFTIMSPLSYFGRRRCGKNARYLYALVFDLDGVGMPQLRDTLHQMNKDILPQATFVVNSGTGLHLYYVLEEPIPMYPHNQKCLKELKYSLTRQIWNRYTSTIKEPQMQGILQGFRVVGSGSKLGREYPVTAYRLGGRVTLEKLLEFIPDSNGEQQQLLGLMRKGRLSMAETREIASYLWEYNINFTIQREIPDNHYFYYTTLYPIHPDYQKRLATYRPFGSPIESPAGIQGKATQFVMILDALQLRLLEKIRSDLAGYSVVRSTSPLDNRAIWLEIFAGGIHKGNSCQTLLKKLNINCKEVAGLGNDYNDIDFLDICAEAYLVANAPVNLQRHYKLVKSDKEEGFTEFISKVL